MPKQDFTKMPVPIRHARIANILDDIGNEVGFSLTPEAAESINALIAEGKQLLRSLQQAAAKPPATPGGQIADLTMTPD